MYASELLTAQKAEWGAKSGENYNRAAPPSASTRSGLNFAARQGPQAWVKPWKSPG